MKRDGRFISILLGIATPLALWLGVEYLNQPSTEPLPDVVLVNSHHRQPEPLAPQQRTLPLREDSGAQPPPREAAPGMAIKCLRNGRVAYTDKVDGVCDTGDSVTQVSTRPAVEGVKPVIVETSIAQPSSQTVAMGIPSRTAGAHSDMCRGLDERIAEIDRLLRLPHDAQMGDHWTALRHELMDQRYAQRC